MFGGGGFGGPPPASDDTELYDTLGVPKTATTSEIKKAFRKAAMKHHPDRGGDAETFKKVNAAYEVLQDDQKREIYDKYGMEGLKEGGGGGGGAEDIFAAMFGGGGRRRGPSGPRKTESISFPLKVTLEELYNGATKKLRLTRNRICSGCDGKGGKGDPKTCATCHGRGVRVVVRQLGPGMLQQFQTACNACNGQGSTIADADRCGTCEGNRVVKEKRGLEVHVNRGSRHGERVIFRGEADEEPGAVAGDVVVVLQQLEHDVFTRRNNDLFIKREISLNEALTGFAFTVTHLDGRTLVVRSDGRVVKPGQLLSITNEGFPHPKNPFQRGELFIEFDVAFPASDEMEPNTVKLLKRILPGASMELDELPEEHEEATLADVDLEATRRRYEEERQREAYEEEEDGGGPQMGGCRQG